MILNYLVHDLTDLFKIRTKKFVPYETDVNVRDLVRDLFDIFAIQAEEKGLELSLLFDDSLPQVLRLDAQRLKQVLVNLLANSLKFTFRGHITVILKY